MAYKSPLSDLFGSGDQTAVKEKSGGYTSPLAGLFDAQKKETQPVNPAFDSKGLTLNVSKDNKPAPTSSADFFKPSNDLTPGSSISTKAIPPQSPVIDKAEQVLSDWYAKEGPGQAAIKTTVGTIDEAANRLKNVYDVNINPASTIPQRLGASWNAAVGLINVVFLPGSVPLEMANSLDDSGFNKLNLPLMTAKYGAKAVKGILDVGGKVINAGVEKAFSYAPESMQPLKQPVEETINLAAMMLAGEALHLTTKGIGDVARSVSEIKDVNGVVKSAASVLNMETKTDLLGRVRKPTVDEVNTQYRRAAQETHPDKGGSVGAFQTVSTAKNVLNDYINLPRKEFTAKWNTPLETVKRAVSGYLTEANKPQSTGFDAEFSKQLQRFDSQDARAGLVEQPSISPEQPATYKFAEPSVSDPGKIGEPVDTTRVFTFEPPSVLPKDFTTPQMRDLIADHSNKIPTFDQAHHVDAVAMMAEAGAKLEQYRRMNTEKIFDVPVGDGKSLASIEVVPYQDGKFTVKTEVHTSGLSLYDPHKTVYTSRTRAIEAAKGKIMDFASHAVSQANSKSELAQLKTVVDAVKVHQTVPVAQEATKTVSKIELVQNPATPEEVDLLGNQDRIMNELIHAEKGERIMISDYESGERRFTAKRSSFPNWVPKELRSRALFDAVLKHVTDGTVPTKAKEIRLYETVRNKMDGQKLAQQFVAENQDVPFFTSEENAAWKNNELTKLYEETRANPENQGQTSDTAAVDETAVPARSDEVDRAVQEAQRTEAAELERVFQEFKAIPKGGLIERPNETVKAPYDIPGELLDVIKAGESNVYFTRRSLKHLAEKGKEGERILKFVPEILTKPDEIYQGDMDNRFLFSKSVSDIKGGRPHVAILEVAEKNGNLVVTAFQSDSTYLSDYEPLWRTGDSAEVKSVPPSAYSSETNAGSRPEFSALKEAQNPKANSIDIRPQEAGKVNWPLQSKVYERLKAENPQLTEELTYEHQNLELNAEKAVELIAIDKEKAYRIAMGVEDPPAGQTATAINIALAEKALEDGNNSLYAQLVRNRSLEQTRRGQELVAEKGSVTDNSTSRYVKELIKARLDKLGSSYLGDLTDKLLKQGKKERATAAIDHEVVKVKERIKSTKELDLNEAQSFLDSLACK